MRIFLLIFVAFSACIAGDAMPAERFLFAGVAQEVEEQVSPNVAAQLRELSALASSEQWKLLGRRAAALGDALVRSGYRDPHAYSVVSGYRAAASAGQGDEIGARWYWQVSLNLWPDLPRTELEPLLLMAPYLLGLEIPSRHQDLTCPAGQLRVRDRRVDRRFLVAHSGKREVDNFWAEGVVGADGRFHSPRLMCAPDDIGGDAAYAGLEGMKDLRFIVPWSRDEPMECPFSIMGRRSRP